MFKKLAITGAIAAALALSVPTVANAYVEGENISVEGNAVAGGTVIISFDGASFGPGATVNITVTGNTAVVVGAVTTGPVAKTAAADGSLDVYVTLPADASGAYEVVATDGTRTGTAAFAVQGAGTGSTGGTATGTGTGTGSTTGNGLASTGQDLPLTAMFVGGGALVLGGIVVGTVYTTRRRGVARQN